ncbi:transposase [Sclerotinia borealis F-4128]|uniref:Transposase n=1 Tax=Sclerotinia borealis (strain F-4128) TaxID=1432307 RepID=W9CEH2_SCLBF|nr:transposase [Sclerotinia borealis F-4128]
MDESEVQIDSEVGREVVVSFHIKEVYEESPENRESVTCIEDMCADGTHGDITLILAGKYHMESWYTERPLTGTETIMLSDTGYIKEELAITWIKSFIKRVGRDIMPEDREIVPWKLMIWDNYKSHVNEEMVILAERYKIKLWTFPLQLTHILQPLDLKASKITELQRIKALIPEELLERVLDPSLHPLEKMKIDDVEATWLKEREEGVNMAAEWDYFDENMDDSNYIGFHVDDENENFDVPDDVDD